MGRWRDRGRWLAALGVIAAIPLSIAVFFWFVVRGSPIGSRSGAFGGRSLEPVAGSIVFTESVEGRRVLRIVPVDGGRPRLLDEELASQSALAWSPDGTQVVYAVESAGGQSLRLMAIATGSPVALTEPGEDGFGQDRAPAWSPDGTTIAFISDRADRSDRSDRSDPTSDGPSISSIFVVLASGGAPRRLGPEPVQREMCVERDGTTRCFDDATGDALRIAWIPGTRDLLYLAEVMGDGGDDQITQLVRLGGDGGAPEVLAEEEGPLDQLVVAPDGRFVLFGLSTAEARVLELATGRTITVGDTIDHPSWTADGTRLVFVDDGQVKAATADGADVENVTKIVHGESIDSTQPGATAWSPDGRHIAFVDDGYPSGDVLYVMNGDGTGQTSVLDADGDVEDLRWLP